MALDLSFGGSQFPRAQEVRKRLYDAGLEGASTRFRQLERLDCFYKCLEYQHLESDWNGYPADKVEAISPDVILPYGFTQPAQDLKLHQRRPSVPLRLTPLVVDRFTDLLFGEDRTPRVRVEDDPMADDFVQAVFKKSHFWREMTQARTYGGAMGSSLVTVQLKPDKLKKKGRFVVKAHSPKTIHDVVWEDPDSQTLAGVLIQYIFFRETEELDAKSGSPTGRVKQVPYLYRRIIDEEMDIVFNPGEIDGKELPDLEVDPYLSNRHGLGVFPGVWIQNMPCADELDGVPDCDGAYQMFEAVDRQLSQQNKALLNSQDPTLVIARDPKLERQGVPVRKGSENALNVGAGGTASYLEMGGSAQTASAAFVKDVKQAAMDKCQVVLADPTTMAGAAQSAQAIKLIFQPMLKKAGRLREQYGTAIEVLTAVILELARKYSRPIEYDGNAVPDFDLDPRLEELDADPLNPDAPPEKVLVQRVPGEGSLISLAWGEFFAPTPADIQLIVGAVSAAVMANLLDTETAIQFVARAFAVEDIEGLKRRVLEEMRQKKAEQQQQIEGVTGLYPEARPVDDQGGTGPGGALGNDEAQPGAFGGGAPGGGGGAPPGGGGAPGASPPPGGGAPGDGGGAPPGSGSYAAPPDAGQPPPPDGGQGGGEIDISDVEGVERLNGAQVTAAKEIIKDVAAQALPREEAKEMLITFFGIDPATVDRIMGKIGLTFFAKEEPPPPRY